MRKPILFFTVILLGSFALFTPTSAAATEVTAVKSTTTITMDGIDTFYEKFPTVPRLPCDLLSE